MGGCASARAGYRRDLDGANPCAAAPLAPARDGKTGGRQGASWTCLLPPGREATLVTHQELYITCSALSSRTVYDPHMHAPLPRWRPAADPPTPYIIVSCPSCRSEIRMPAASFTINYCTNRDGANWLGFDCGQCAQPVACPLAPMMESLLTAHGVKRIPFTMPAEVDERPRDAEPLSWDDVLDFRNALHAEAQR